jgi:hypothetical protein
VVGLLLVQLLEVTILTRCPMPTVFSAAGFDFVIRTRDHLPPHVHALGNGGEVLVNLGDARTGPSLREVRGRVKPRDVVRAVREAEAKQADLLARWRQIHE